MRLLRSLGNALPAAVFALVLPLAQAQAQAQPQQCVDYQGLRHCSIGSARLSMTEEGLKVTSGSTTGSDGVSINMGLVSTWTAETSTPALSRMPQRTVFTSVSESSSTSTATVTQEGERSSVSATFTGSGSESTYSLMVYHQGVLQASVGGIRNGQIAARMAPGGNGPSCRAWGTTYDQCLQSCYDNQYSSCSYCSTVCPRPDTTFHVRYNAACQWTFRDVVRDIVLTDGRIVRGDEIQLVEEVRGPSSYPYLGFNQINIQTTAPATYLGNESVIPASK